jgi:hypothetical protein
MELTGFYPSFAVPFEKRAVKRKVDGSVRGEMSFKPTVDFDKTVNM